MSQGSTVSIGGSGGGSVSVNAENTGGRTAAQVNFRVRCERLGHGEDLYLIRSEDVNMRNRVPLYTTVSDFPWYQTLQPINISLPPCISTETSPSRTTQVQDQHHFYYRYAVFRSGVFYRWEEPSDCPDEVVHHEDKIVVDDHDGGETMDVDEPTPTAADTPLRPHSQFHEIPLRHLQHREMYTIHNVLGMTSGPLELEHVKWWAQPEITTADSLLRKSISMTSAPGASNSATPPSSHSRVNSTTSFSSARSLSEKHVGFAPTPPPFFPRHQQLLQHQRQQQQAQQQQQQQQQQGGSNESGASPFAKKPQAVNLSSSDGLVVVSAFLPVVLHRNEHGEWKADWDYEMLLSMQTHLRVTRVGIVKWRGWHGNRGIDGSPEGGVPVEDRPKVEKCLRPFNCVPVWIEPTLFGEMYNGFCKGVLWPVLHNVTSVYKSRPDKIGSGFDRSSAASTDASSMQFSDYSMDDFEQGPIHGDGGKEAELWASYNAVNRQFADVVVQCFNEGDMVWIHGFHLLILPSYLTRRIPMAKVGIFLHTPFPSSEIFRTVWCREDLLRGMLNADQVGFHLFEYARHFLTCCRRLLGMNYGMIPDASGGHTLAIDANGRHVAVTSIHAGIEPPVLNQMLQHDVTLKKAISIRNQFRGKVVFCAIDRLESLKGIPLKLLGLERFLTRCPEWVGKIVLIQVGISAFERGDDYFRTKKEVVEFVNRLNQRWPGTVHFQECAESDMRLQQRMALLRAADVVLVTPIRDGLNLVPLEFSIAHQDALTETGKRDGRKRGICILSEFSSCTRVMRGALHVNPWKVSEIATAFHSALTITEDERLRRISCALEFVTRVTTQRWALAVMLDLKGVHKNVNPIHNAGAGFGLGYRRLGMDTGFIALDMDTVIKSYRSSRSRLILVDYGGTIVSNDNLDNLTRFQMVKHSRAPSVPTKSMIQAIKSLCQDKRNTVFVVSGKETHTLSKTLGHIKNLGLAAEHGMFISWPSKSRSATSKRRWETLVPDTDKSWRELAISIMEVYTSRTHGSYIEETEMKVLWQYRDADPEFSYLQSKELEDHLSNVLRNFAVDILHGGMKEGGYVEVRPKGVNKGVLAMHVISKFPLIAPSNKVDFCLVLGDDHCDEPMLSVVRQIGRRVLAADRAKKSHDPLPDLPSTMTLVDVSSCDDYISSDLEVFTCTVGKKPSAAANYVHEVSQVQELFDSLVKVSTREQKFHSSSNLVSFGISSDASKNAVSGMVKSRSLTEMAPIMTSDTQSVVNVSRSLNEYMTGLSSIQGGDTDDEDGNFF